MSDDDLIRRGDAIAVVPGPRHDFAPYQDTVTAIRALPAVQPDAGLAMRIAVEMEVHASIGTTTKAKADAILALINSTGKGTE